RDDRRRRHELEQFETRLLQRREQHRRELDDRLLAAAVTVRLATTGAGGTEPDPSCWQRRSRSRDAYTVRLGRGPHPWTPPLRIDASRTAPDVRALIDRAGLIPAAPIPLHLEA